MNKSLHGLLTLMLAVLLTVSGTGCTSKARKAYHKHRADTFYAAGQYDRAEVEYLNVLRNDNGNAEAYARLGQIYYLEGRIQNAAPFLSKAISMATNDLDLRLKLGYIEANFANFKEARSQAEFILSRKPQDDEAPILLADVSVTPKDVAATRTQLETLAKAGDRAAYEVGLGTLAYRERDMTVAEAAFKKALILDPKSPAALEAMGGFCASQNDLKGAEAYFKAAADVSDARSTRKMMYARFKMQSGDDQAARQILSDVIKQAPDYVPALLGLAEIALTERKYDDARNYSNQVLTRDGDNFDGLIFQSRLAMAQEDYAAAASDLERMSKLYPQASGVQCQLALAYLGTDDDTKAIICLNRALELDPNFTEAMLLLAQVQIKDRNPDPAMVSMTDLAQKQPQLEEAQLLLSDAYRMHDRMNDALALYRSLEQKFPKDPKLPLLVGSAYLELKDSAQARTAFEQVQQLAPGNLEALLQLVNLDLAETNYVAATQRIQTELQKSPKEISLYLLVAQVQMAEGKWSDAETTLLKTDELDPGNEDVGLLLSKLYLKLNQIDKALARLEGMTTKDPRNIQAWLFTAVILEQQKDYKAAAAVYEKILAVNPRFTTALNNVAYIYSEDLGQLDHAYDLAQQARVLQPFDPSTADTLGWICLKRGSYGPALGLLQEAVGKLSTIPEVQFHYGMANYMTDNEAAARTAFQQALQSGTEFHGQEECRLCLSLLDINPQIADATAQTKLEKRVADKSADPVASGRLAVIYLRNGNNEKAITAYEAVVQTDPKNVPAMLALAKLYAPKDSAKAMQMAKAVNQVAPNNVDAMHIMGQIAYQGGDFKLAASWLQQAVKNQPNDAQSQFDYARAAYNIGYIPAANAALQSALDLHLPPPQSTDAQRMLDMTRLAANPPQAVAAAQQVKDILAGDPNYVPAIMAHAVIQMQNSDLATAAADGEKILARLPDFAPAQRLLAIIYSKDHGKISRAYELAMKARDDYPNDTVLAKAIAIIVFQQGDYPRAERLLLTCVGNPDVDAETYYYLGSAQVQLRENVAGKTSLQQALAMHLSGPLADNAKKILAALK